MKDYHDLPRSELMERAREALENIPGAILKFKFTCQHCGERCTFNDPFTLYEKGECAKCGKETVVDKGGFLIEYHMQPQ